jgi:hypothetical protein
MGRHPFAAESQNADGEQKHDGETKGGDEAEGLALFTHKYTPFPAISLEARNYLQILR